MKFFALFSLQLWHAYYRDGRCLDFAIEPTSATQQLLKNHRCVLKTTPNGLRVLIAGTAPQTPLIALPLGAVFSFHLRLQNPAFARFTDLSAMASQPAPLYTNSAAGAAGRVPLTLGSRQARLAAGVFADVEITVTEALRELAAEAVEFAILFAAKQARWAYYCITDLNSAATPLRIVDGDASPVVFSDANRRHLNEQPDPTDAVAVALGARYPEQQRFRLVSDQPIACQQGARKHLQLQWGSNRLAAALPNPALQHSTTMSVADGQTAALQEVFFHVITYFTHTFATTGS